MCESHWVLNIFVSPFQENDVIITDEREADTLSQRSESSLATGPAEERPIDIGRVGLWATDFEKLLADPVGLYTFTV